ncbi:MAG: hypothetical protein AAB463_01650 [Patescibacteria group bacterium]
MSQRNLLLSLIALSLSASGGVGWYLVNNLPGKSLGAALILQQGSAHVPEDKNLSPSPIEQSTSITERTVSFMTAGPTSTSILFIDTPSGRVYRVDTETREEVPLSLRISDLIDVRWSPLKTSLIAKVRTPQGEQLRLVRLGEQKTSVLPKAIAAAFSPDGLSLATLEPGEPGGIFTQKLDGSERVRWTQTRTRAGDIFWPQPESLGLMITNQATKTGDVFLVNKAGDLTRLIAHHATLEVLWSPDGTSLAHMPRQGGALPGISITTPLTLIETSLTTVPKLCAWRKDASHILCAIKNGQETSLVSYSLKTDRRVSMAQKIIQTMGVRALAINTLETQVFLVPASGVGIYTVPLNDSL